ncbi:MAG: 50S ribosomal protein L10 [Clostridia bacterium]|nr:50S ribosomal protein L10 [Clostridia bacterium]
MNQEVLAAKKQQVEEIKAKITSAKSIVLVDYMGLTVAQDTAFRKELRENGVDYAVLKNRLVKIAFNELGYTQFDEALNGPTAVAFSSTDAVAPAKFIFKNIKALNKMKTKCGMVEGEFMDEAGLKKIADIPSKEVLIAKMLGSMQSPLTKLAMCLKQIAEQKEQQA